MAKDPAFLFYPGDYLRDTQCLSEKSQVAYDRIMCEHMRNICITQEQLNFFTKRLSEDEKNEVLMLLKKIRGGFQIEWVADSICKRKDYSESRRKNRQGKPNNISTTYDSHMENANVIENEDESKIEKRGGRFKLNEIGELPEIKIGAAKQLLKIVCGVDASDVEIIELWEAFKIQTLTGEKYYKSVQETHSHFINWLQTKKINGRKTFTPSTKTAGAYELLERLKKSAPRRKTGN